MCLLSHSESIVRVICLVLFPINLLRKVLLSYLAKINESNNLSVMDYGT
jgi:hypothetical protein